ncbi:MAG: hypothetical protein GKR89_10445 [Candidatus Latescibacteria bacterium]|nr:hypothetical protein [Candidatus Latescibacterota bacterium]
MPSSDNQTRSQPRYMELTVGPAGADIQGTDDKALQAGADYLKRLGGGTLHILPGTYTMRNALYLHAGVDVKGSGEDTVLHKAPSVCTPLVRDADWYENQVEVADPSGFHPGCGIVLRCRHNGELQVVKDTVVAVNGPLLSLSRRLEKNMWLDEEATAATLFPLLTAEGVDDVEVSDLVLDGNLSANEELNGNYVGGLFIQHCDRHFYQNVIARNYNGDGFSFQVCDDIHFDRCGAENNANLGFHPGSGSQRPVFRHCRATGNSQGIFFCWGVTHGLVEDCTCTDNRDYGISIGHRDTDNRIVDTVIEANHKVGLLFRRPESPFRGGHRNTIEGCRLNDNGFAAQGIGIDIQPDTHDITIGDCAFADSGQKRQRLGIHIAAGATGIETPGNSFNGLEQEQQQEQ